MVASTSTSTSTSTKKKPAAKKAAKLSAPKGESSRDTPKKSTKKAGSEASKKVLVIVESPAKARTISQLLKKAGGGRFDGYTVDACNGHVTDLVGKRRDVPPELKEKTKKWDVVGVDVVRSPSCVLLCVLRPCSTWKKYLTVNSINSPRNIVPRKFPGYLGLRL